MKLFASLLAVLFVLVVLIAVPVISRRPRPGPDCTSQIAIVRSSPGEPLECVCIGGTLSTCFNPGP